MFQKLCFALILLAFEHSAYAQINLSGQCPQFNLMDKYDSHRSVGLWYLFGSYDSETTRNLKCLDRTEDYIAVYTDQTYFIVVGYNQTTNKKVSYDGIAKYTGERGEHLVTIHQEPFKVHREKRIVVTDYDSYSINFFCENLENNTHNLMVWVMTRDRLPSAETVNKINSILDENNVSLEPLVKIVQTDCPEPIW